MNACMRPPTQVPAGVRLAAAACGLAGVLLASAVPRTSVVPADVVVVAVCLICSYRAPLGAAVAVGAIAWGAQDGFAVHRFGTLGASAGDLAVLAGLLAASLGTAVLSRVLCSTGVRPSGGPGRPGSVRTERTSVRPPSGRVPVPRRHG